MGYDYAQGYYYSRALPVDAFLNWLQKFGAPKPATDNLDTSIAGAA